ncbi:MAG TPA: NB-ARC domain-containing protein, partial [Ktedonobacterales bacterium]
IVPVMHQETPLWPFLADLQVIDFNDPTRFQAAFADLLVAVRLGYTRQAELIGLRGVRRGPPFDLDRLPLQERFIGRDDAIEWALERLAPDLSLRSPRVVDVGNGRLGSRMASIAATNGLAGIGKSALAGALARMLHATDRYPDGIAVVACNDLTDPVTVLRRALARFDLEEKEPPEQTVEQLSGLAQRVFGKLPRALIILDNVEPALDIAQVTKPLRVAGAALLLTSRQRLPSAAVSADDSRELELLSPQEAVAVFLENRQRENEPVEATPSEADRAAIAQIVEALGCHTLAVKLAAPRSRGRDLARLAAEYTADPRLGLKLRDANVDPKPGDKVEAVDVVMSSSVASAPAPARQLFAALGAFASNDIGRDALLAVGGALGDPDTAASLDALLDLRLADAYLSADLPAGADRERLRLHPLVRAFARDLLDGERTVADDPPWPAERRTEALRAMTAWYANYTNATPDEARLLDEANIGGALAWAESDGDDRLLARLVNGMVSFWEVRSRTEARQAYLPLAVAAAQRVATASD